MIRNISDKYRLSGACHGRIQRGGGMGSGPPPPWKNHKNIGFPSNIDTDLRKITKLPSQHSMVGHWHASKTPFFKGVSLMGRWWSILVAFRSFLTIPSDKMFWIRACMQCVWTGSIEIKLSTDIILWYFGTYNVRQRLRRACASMHSQFSVDGSGMSSITAFMLNGLILCLTTQTTTWKRALLYISSYKQTNLANLLCFLTL